MNDDDRWYHAECKGGNGHMSGYTVKGTEGVEQGTEYTSLRWPCADCRWGGGADAILY